MSVATAPVWTSPQKLMPPVGEVVDCMLRHHSTNTIQEHKLKHVQEDDLSWRTTDGAELSYDWEVLCWKHEDPRVDVHAVMAKLHGYATEIRNGRYWVELDAGDVEEIIEAMRSLIFEPAAGIDDSDRERLLWCARTIRAIVDRDDKQPLGYTWWGQAVMVVGTIKRVLNMSDEEFSAANVRPIEPIDYEARFRAVLKNVLGDAYYCVKPWDTWYSGKMRASDFVRFDDSLSGRVNTIVKNLTDAMK